MKTKPTVTTAALALLALFNLNSQLSAFAQGTAFNYQGNLIDSGQPANNLYDLTFTLWNASTTGGGSPVGVTFTNLATPVTNGLFTVTLDFSATPPNPPNTPNPFTGAPLWLQIGVRLSSTGPAGAFTEISPLQPILTAPYAIFANTASNLSGTVSAAQVTSIGNSGGGSDNFFVGPAGNPNTSGEWNSAIGVDALLSNTSGSYNTAGGAYALFVNTSGSFNTAIGLNALFSNTTGSYNTAGGANALVYNTTGTGNTAGGVNALLSNTSGSYNTAGGVNALFNNTTGGQNTANGFQALTDNLTGGYNTAGGAYALFVNTSGSYNTAEGEGALAGNSSGTNNIALGYQAGIAITTGSSNIDIGNFGFSTDNNTIRLGDPSVHTAAFIAGVINGNGGGLTNLNAARLADAGNDNLFVGSLSGNATSSGGNNTAIGDEALLNNTAGSNNVSVGFDALNNNTIGSYNTAGGVNALYNNTSGSYNTAGGVGALYNNTSGSYNTAIGDYALAQMTSGGGNIALGYEAGSYYESTEQNNIVIGNDGTAGDNNTIRIGDPAVQTSTYIAGIYGVSLTGGSQVYVDSTGHLGTGGSGGGSGPLPSYVVTNNETQFVTLLSGLSVAGLVLPAITTTTTTDTILSGTNLLLYNDYYGDFCAGQSAGKRLNTSITHPANTAIGVQALYTDVNAGGNSAIGYQALYNCTNGGNNVAVGQQALFTDAAAGLNTAVGNQALYNCTGSGNIALGIQAGYGITTGVNNIDIGNAGASTDNNIIRIGAAQTYAFIAGIISGNGSGLTSLNGAQLTGVITGNGAGLTNLNVNALQQLSGGVSGNFFVGPGSGSSTTSGSTNMAIGISTLFASTSGDYNTAIGDYALAQMTSGGGNIALGYEAGNNFLSSESQNIDIGNRGVVGDNNTIRLGDPAYQTTAYIAGISGATISGGAAVYVDTTTGQLGVESSSAQFKTDIQSMGDASDVLLALQPVTFKYKPGIDPKGLPQFGLIAEQVENVDPELVVHDAQHGIYTVRYEAVNAMLLNEFQKEHRTVEEQKTEIETLKQKAGRVDALEQRLNELEQMVQTLAEKK